MEFKLSNERIGSRFQCVIKDDLITNIYDNLNAHWVESTEDIFKYRDKETENVLLNSIIEANQLYFDELKFSIYLDEGAEQKVFFDDLKGNVVKLNDAIFYVNWSQYLESLIIHNLLFTETKYELLGFVKINNAIYSVVEQDYILPTRKTETEEIRNFMLSKGFSLKRKNDYIHSEFGLIIEDLHEENVLVKDDVLFFIDTVIYLK